MVICFWIGKVILFELAEVNYGKLRLLMLPYGGNVTQGNNNIFKVYLWLSSNDIWWKKRLECWKMKCCSNFFFTYPIIVHQQITLPITFSLVFMSALPDFYSVCHRRIVVDAKSCLYIWPESAFKRKLFIRMFLGLSVKNLDQNHNKRCCYSFVRSNFKISVTKSCWMKRWGINLDQRSASHPLLNWWKSKD